MSHHTPRRVATEALRLLKKRSHFLSSPVTRLPARTAPFSSRSAHTTTTTTKPFHDKSNHAFSTRALIAGTGLLSLLAIFIIHDEPSKVGEEPSQISTLSSSPTNDTRDPTLPRYRLSEVRLHDASSPNPWIVYQDKVYDITDWVPAHPGGDVILRAAGQSIDPYWAIFTIHKQPHVRQILDGYLIGLIHTEDLVDGRPPGDAIRDPFAADPVRDPRMTRHTAKPCNAEPPNRELDAEFLTPNELFYVRNHMWVPEVVVVAEEKDEKEEGDGGRKGEVGSHKQHTLTIELPDGEERTYTLQELQSRFRTHRVTAALQCSGNRRSDMTRHADKTNGLQWGVGAISNAEWEGVRLMDVLADAGLKVADQKMHTGMIPSTGTTSSTTTTIPEIAKRTTIQDKTGEKEEIAAVADPNTHHVQFTGLEAYGASIPLSTAIDPRNDVLLAFGMNGVALPPDHGFPLRVVVPGHVAARSVKWLSRIVVADEESTSQWQRRDYKSFGPNERAPDWDKAPPIQEMPITSAITKVLVGQCVRESRDAWVMQKLPEWKPPPPQQQEQQEQPIALQGYAISGGGREITRVDVSLDGGRTWDQAELVVEDQPYWGNRAWAWKRWRYLGTLAVNNNNNNNNPGTCAEVVVKATDNNYNSQPETHASIYNLRGNLANAWHRVRVCPKCVTTANPPGVQGNDAAAVIWRTGDAFGCGFGNEKGNSKST